MHGKVGGGKMIEEERPERQGLLPSEASVACPWASTESGKAVEAAPRADTKVLVGVVAVVEAVAPVAFTISPK